MRIRTSAGAAAVGCVLALIGGGGTSANATVGEGAAAGPVGSAAAAACNPLPIAVPSVGTTAKKVFAFYFPPFPVSVENKAPTEDYYSRWVYSLNSQGGAYDLRDRPIGRNPLAQTTWKQADFETEVRRAIEVGIDGFIWEYHDSTDQRWNQLPALLAAAKAVNPAFKIMLSPDYPETAGASQDPVVTVVARVKDDSSLYRLADGRIVLAPFRPELQPPAWWGTLHDKLAAQGVQTALLPIFLSWSGSTTEKAEWNSYVYGYSSWGNRWVSATGTYTKDSQEAHARGRIWMSPAAFEDTRSYDGRYWEASNSGLWRSSFEKAIQADADLVALITWNDYTESWVSPSRERGSAVTDVASYYINWFKSGHAPAITQDGLYYFHRAHRTDAPYTTKPIGRNGSPVDMYVDRGDAASNQVELVAVLKTAGRLVIRQGTDVRTLDAAAGVVSFKVAMVPGTTPVFELQRGGQTVQTVTSRTPITAQPTFQDMMYHAGGGTACVRP